MKVFKFSTRPKLWKDNFYKEEKSIQSYSFFQIKLKSKLLQVENKTKYFENYCSLILIEKLQSSGSI